MRLKIFFVAIMLSSFASADSSKEMMCSLEVISKDKCKKGDVIYSTGSVRHAATVCDIDKQISMSEKGFVCSYIGYKREKRQ